MARKPARGKPKKPSALMQRLGAEIRRRREHLGISQSEVARLSETDRLFLGLVERGEKNASIETPERVTRVLKIRLSTLLEKAEKAPSPRS